jgi:aminoglycoside phosphotransferase (APT) family kinase protein
MLERLVDPEIPSLAIATDSEAMLPILRGVFGETIGADFSAVNVRVLRYKPRRNHCVMEYGLARADGSEFAAYIGKVFSKQRRAKRLFRVIDALHRELGALTPGPVPMAYLQEHALVIMGKLSGVPLEPVLNGSDEAAAIEGSALAASALALLHSVSVEEGKAGTFEEEMASVRKHTAEYGHHDPLLAAEGERLLVEIEDLASRLPQPAAPSLTHGSFRPTEVLLTPPRAAIFDLDAWALRDPAFDLGYYLAELWLQSEKNRQRMQRYGDVFLEQYVAQSEGNGLRERALMYEAFTYVRSMLKKLRAIERGRDSSEAIEQAQILNDRARVKLSQIDA